MLLTPNKTKCILLRKMKPGGESTPTESKPPMIMDGLFEFLNYMDSLINDRKIEKQLGSISTKLDTKIGSFDSKFDSQLDSISAQSDEQSDLFSSFDLKCDSQLDSLNAQLDEQSELFSSLGSSIETSFSSLSSTIEAVRLQLDTKLDSLSDTVDRTISNINNHVTEGKDIGGTTDNSAAKEQPDTVVTKTALAIGETENSELDSWREQASNLLSGLATQEWEDFKKQYDIEPISRKEWNKQCVKQLNIPKAKKLVGSDQKVRDAERPLKSIKRKHFLNLDEIIPFPGVESMNSEEPIKQSRTSESFNEEEENDSMRLIEANSDYNKYAVTVDVIRPNVCSPSELNQDENSMVNKVSLENNFPKKVQIANGSTEELDTRLRKAFMDYSDSEPDISSDEEESIGYYSDEELVDSPDNLPEDNISEPEPGAELDESYELVEFVFDEKDDLISVQRLKPSTVDPSKDTQLEQKKPPDICTVIQTDADKCEQFQLPEDRVPPDKCNLEMGHIPVMPKKKEGIG